MGLKILPGRDGGTRPTWYARFTRRGRKVDINLGVPIRGTIPTRPDEWGIKRVDLSRKGDAAFEQSRAQALAELERMKVEVRTTGDAREVKNAKDALQAARYYRARTGQSVKGVRLGDLAELWIKQKRSYTPSAIWTKAVATWFARFAAFAAKYASEHGGRCETVDEITPEIATAWFDALRTSFTWETVTKQMSLLRNAYARYAVNKDERNPFADIVMRNRETANARKPHRPLAGVELERLFDATRDNAALYPLIVTAACTGMRIGDVCNLKWEDVDLGGGIIDCTTAKAGVRASIPIIGRLREVLTAASAIDADGKAPSPFVFPFAAERYRTNPTGVYREAKPYFARAVFVREEPGDALEADAKAPPPLESVIGQANFADAKRARLLEEYRLFKSGTASAHIAARLGVSRAQVSMDLAEIERLTGESLRPVASLRPDRKSNRDLLAQTREKREVGRRAASLYGWHSLRATFVVLATEAGVPLADIARIVGHTTTDMTMEYFNPEKKHAAERVRRQMRGTALDAPAPTETITQGDATPVDALVASLTVDERKELARRLLGL